MSDISSLKQRLQEDMKNAMREKDTQSLSVIRMILAGIKQKEVDERIVLDDTQVVAIINKMLKQLHESLKQFQEANRKDLATKANFEVDKLKTYLPAQLSETEVDMLIQEAILTTQAKSPQDMGKVVNFIKSKAQGNVDMSSVSNKIKIELSQKPNA